MRNKILLPIIIIVLSCCSKVHEPEQSIGTYDCIDEKAMCILLRKGGCEKKYEQCTLNNHK